MSWVIEHTAPLRAWIEGSSSDLAFRVTLDFKRATRFVCREDAANEILLLGLSGQWLAVEEAKKKEAT